MPVNKGLNAHFECGKISRCDIRGPKELDFVLCMLYLCSIASKLKSIFNTSAQNWLIISEKDINQYFQTIHMSKFVKVKPMILCTFSLFNVYFC